MTIMTRLMMMPFLALTSLAPCGPAVAQESEQETVELPAPAGQFAVGSYVWRWIDEERPLDRGAADKRRREIMAQLWFPAEPQPVDAKRPYRPLAKGRFNFVVANATPGAPFAEDAGKARVIVLCPGRGVSAGYNSVVAEGLASQGYAVLALDSPGLGYVEYPDGRVDDTSGEFQPSFELITGPYEKVDEFFEPAVELGLADYRFALDTLKEIGRKDAGGRFTGRLDFSKIGVYGHSLGGRICGSLAQVDRRVAAFAAMEGVAPPEARRGGYRGASLMLYSSELPEEMALPNIREIFDFRKGASTILRLEGFGHNSVTDRPILFPDSFNYSVEPERALRLTIRILTEFFGATFDDRPFPVEKLAEEPEITIVETSLTPPNDD